MIERRGGARPNSGPKPGTTTNEALGLPSVRKVTVGFYPDDLERVQKLIDAGYGSNRADVVRTAVLEAMKRVQAQIN